MIEESLQVCKAWGFVPKSEIVWIKTYPNGNPVVGLGRYVRNCHEVCTIAARGKGASLIKDHTVLSAFGAERKKHSQKPDEFYRMVESLLDGPRAEMFARKVRPGWEQYGNQLGSIEE